MQHEVKIRKMKTTQQWVGMCEGCTFMVMVPDKGAASEMDCKRHAEFHQEQHAKKEAARASRRVQR